MNANQAIENLQMMSEALERAANSPKNYNTPFAQYLENMSWEMSKMSNDLREIDYLYGVAL